MSLPAGLYNLPVLWQDLKLNYHLNADDVLSKL